MKIALCLSGQLRDWRQSSGSMLALVKQLNKKFNASTDIFCQMWEFNSPRINKSYEPGLYYYGVRSTLISEEEKREVLTTYKPKSYKFESEWISQRSVIDFIKIKLDSLIRGESCWDPSHSASQYFAIETAVKMMKAYEIKNNFVYDICIRSRYDLFFDDYQVECFMENDATLPTKNALYACHSDLTTKRLGDVFWLSDSETIGKVVGFCKWLHTLDYSLIPYWTLTESIIWDYMNDRGVDVKLLYSDPRIVTKE